MYYINISISNQTKLALRLLKPFIDIFNSSSCFSWTKPLPKSMHRFRYQWAVVSILQSLQEKFPSCICWSHHVADGSDWLEVKYEFVLNLNLNLHPCSSESKPDLNQMSTGLNMNLYLIDHILQFDSFLSFNGIRKISIGQIVGSLWLIVLESHDYLFIYLLWKKKSANQQK